ncbi:MAG: glycerophosphodiester phosphodiesterase family protein [Roseovarius sp.]
MSALPEAFRRVPIAHRALHDVRDGRPENSRAAILAAIEHGYGVEIDLQLSRDGAAIVFHDYDLRRLTPEQGPIRQRDADELARVPLNGGEETIPGFAEILTLVDGRAPLLVELKDQHGQMGETDGTLEAETARALEGYAGDVALMSFNPHMVARMADFAPDRPRGIVSEAYPADDWPLLREETRARLRGIPDAEAVGASFISQHWRDLGRARVAELKAAGLAVLCWTVRSPEDEAVARRVADNITFEGYLAAQPG